MKTGLHQHTALRQDLRINPRLYQAMDLLYMPLLDLQQHLKQELLGNPFLELIEPEDETELPLTQDGVEEKKETENNDEPNWEDIDRKSTRLNSSHGYISYAVFCLKKKKSRAAYVTRIPDRDMSLRASRAAHR